MERNEWSIYLQLVEQSQCSSCSEVSKANSFFQNVWIASNIPLCCFSAQTSHQCFLLFNCDSIRKHSKTNSLILQIPQMPFKNISCSLTLRPYTGSIFSNFLISIQSCKSALGASAPNGASVHVLAYRGTPNTTNL